MTRPLISVIVPVYNVEAYLDTCVQSIVDQTYSNLEIILVDDGSPDNCGEMCDGWAQKDDRIHVIHKQNGGQAEARNVGIEAATGEYIGFVDSDDYIHPDMYEDLYGLLNTHNAQLAECRMIKFETVPFDGFPQETETVTVFTKEEAVKNLINERVFSCTVPNILVEAAIAKAVLFDVGKIHEDILWPYRVFCKTSRVVHTTRRYYAYYQREGSTMNSAYSEKRFDALDALQQRAREVKTDFPSLYPLAEKMYAGACMYHYQSLCRLPKNEEYVRFQKRLHKRFCNADRKFAFANVSMKQQMWYALFAKMPRLTCKLRNLLKIGL